MLPWKIFVTIPKSLGRVPATGATVMSMPAAADVVLGPALPADPPAAVEVLLLALTCDKEVDVEAVRPAVVELEEFPGRRNSTVTMTRATTTTADSASSRRRRPAPLPRWGLDE